MSPPALFVVGAGTEIGKTYTTAALVRRLCGQGRRVRALKPLASGVPPLDHPDFAESDTGRLLAAQGLALTPETVEACSPWRFIAPLAPDLAAAREGRSLTLPELVAWCSARLAEAGDGETVVIEGVGGLMSPITEDATGLDWLKSQAIPALLVSGSYLGAISHALTAVETLRAHAIPLVGIVVSESEGAPVPVETVAGQIARLARVPVGCLGRGGDFPENLPGIA
ncbi:Dethiobiotin synthetase (Dethiobiotin synthase) (DTB synthetase) (DTBS) [Methylorubrum extorquens DM4]|uniref:ATP-dependent dethiobiotin synthetase BioD n=1 Tax=Methylorubrum extorquens (strain DSM 6343 / CIP 106787 / DM4) TaxID=661410 RepID=C7CLD7_METED|nr:dethiobiotin synthase [Methylorubrum extorquens]CAX24766.1 Dethiobiotin synthetase (Dethiobiotin synthase) (DTB synthetase) (DTBS) [Methylorubrum extorquens DM4]